MKVRYLLLLIVATFIAAHYVLWDSALIRQSGLEIRAGGVPHMLVYSGLVVVLSTLAGLIYGSLVA